MKIVGFQWLRCQTRGFCGQGVQKCGLKEQNFTKTGKKFCLKEDRQILKY